MLNNKQKFWLKFQKERIIEIDQNSEEERRRKRKEKESEANDLIKALHRGDAKALKKVEKMIKYLQHGNKTAFDQKIIGGLFEEYCSDSEEEENANKVMDTEEERKEFYSLALHPDPEPPRKKQFNKGKPGAVQVDFSALKNLYNNENSITSIGAGPQYRSKELTTSMTSKSKPNKNKKSSETYFSQLTGKKTPINKKSTVKFTKSPATTKSASKFNKIMEDYEGDDDMIVDSQSNTKMKSASNRPESELDHTRDDFITKAERQIVDNGLIIEDSNKDFTSAAKENGDPSSQDSVKLDKDANEGGSRQSNHNLNQKPFNIKDY
jgi:hypothetical protein